jgi:eukaryotic-like serine/threonine-protein kinase
VPDPVASSSDSELRAHVQRALSQHYELDAEIGRGGMGIVYRAKDRRLKRTVAIKVLPPELAFRSEIKIRFLREAETAAQLNHPNIVDIYSVDEAEQLVYFVMAYVSGDNLAKRLHDHGTLSVDETRRTMRDVADALAYAHERGVVHRDIKPDNILLDAESGRPMVTDFGIAFAVSEGDTRLTATGIAIGTPTYMSPEQAAGERQIDGRSDLYSLGILGYQMLTGEPPFIAHSTPAVLVKHISERPTPVEQRRGDVPQDLARIIMTLLEKDPAHRFPSATSVVAALDTGQLPVLAQPREGDMRPAETSRQAPTYGSATSERAYSHTFPTAADLARWEAPPVQKFRRKLAPYLFVNGVIVLFSAIGQNNIIGFTVLWSIYLAFKYAKLWADGYDWRDVFRQPRDRELIDVFDEFLMSLRGMFNRTQRHALREERRARRIAQQRSMPALPAPGAAGSDQDAIRVAGAYGDRIRRAEVDRDEIIRLLSRLSPADRAQIPDVDRSARALADKVRMLAISLADAERGTALGAADEVEAEISRLEGAANPLDHVASEERVRRLAHLKRQRRALADLTKRRNSVADKLETCVVALENIKFDLLRLGAGARTHQHITSLAVDALSLADSVDSALFVADEMNRASGTATSSRSSASRG